jgi:glycosyltransferase involved in cell wall biosynthesis
MIWKLAPKIALRLTRIEIYTDAIAEQVLALRPEIVHCHDVHTLPVGAAAKIQIGSSIVYDAHEIYEAVAQVNGRRAEHYKQLHKKYAASVSRFITINESIGEWYATNHPKLPRATIIMNATVPAGKITYDGRLHTASGLADSSRIVLYQGGFAHKRGLSQLVESAARLPLDWYLVMMGGGQIQRRLEDTAAKVNSHCREAGRADDVVRFVPAAPLPELAQWTGGATLGVIPYEDAGLNHHFCTPNKLWEYPNAGVPLLVSPLPEMVRIVQKHNIGWVLPRFGDSPEFASGVPDVVANLTDESLARAREACTAFIAQESWDKYAIELVELYSSLASEKQGRN